MSVVRAKARQQSFQHLYTSTNILKFMYCTCTYEDEARDYSFYCIQEVHLRTSRKHQRIIQTIPTLCPSPRGQQHQEYCTLHPNL